LVFKILKSPVYLQGAGLFFMLNKYSRGGVYTITKFLTFYSFVVECSKYKELDFINHSGINQIGEQVF
jgi:hypothetical protein